MREREKRKKESEKTKPAAAKGQNTEIQTEGRRLSSQSNCRRGSILGQDVDFTKLLLNLLDSLDAIGALFSDLLGRQGRPGLIAWYDRNRDCSRAVIKRR